MISRMTECGGLVPTSNTGKKLSCEILYLCAWKWDKAVTLQKIEDALAEQVRNNAYVIPVIKRVSKVYTFVAIRLVVE